jgi:integrase
MSMTLLNKLHKRSTTRKGLRARRAKAIRKTEAGNIIKLPDGRFRIDCIDSRGKRHRPAFATEDEAIAVLSGIAAKKFAGEFFADGANTTFAKALDLLIERNQREGLATASRERVKSVINAHLRPVFGARKLSEFAAQRMRFVQEWMDQQAKHHHKAAMTLAHFRSALKLAFHEAIRAGLMGAPNPVTEFGLRVPHIVKKTEREVLTLEEISALRGASLRRADKEHELTYCVRFMLVLVGLLAGLRNGECSGLQWDCIDFGGRRIHVRRAWRKGEGIIAETKTGKSGYRTVPMSPILYAALHSHADRLRSFGYTTEGPVPVLRTKQAPIIVPLAISQAHWAAIAAKAGFVDDDGGLDHTFYALRHTCANLWRTIGIQPDRLMKLMGHTDYHTTVKNYLHETPHFEVVRREVETLCFERTPEGYIDGLGVVLARRWRDEGIDVAYAPPQSTTPQMGYGGPVALPGNTIDLQLTAVSTELEPSAPAIGSALKSVEQLRLWQIARAKELFRAGWPKLKIANELGVAFYTVREWLRSAGLEIRRGRLPKSERAELMDRVAQMRKQQPNISANEMAKALGVAPRRIVQWERAHGRPMPHQPGAHKLGKYDAQIRQMVAEGKTFREMQEILRQHDPKGPSHSALSYYVERMGLRNLRPIRDRHGRMRIETLDTRIRKLVAEGKSKEAIARELASELGGASRSGILYYIKRKGLRTIPGNRGQRIAKIKETLAPR